MGKRALVLDPAPKGDVPSADLKALAAKLRDEAQGLPYDPCDSTFDVLATYWGVRFTRQ